MSVERGPDYGGNIIIVSSIDSGPIVIIVADDGDSDDIVDGSGVTDRTPMFIAAWGGHDLLKGGNGDDILDGGADADTMIGGLGNDIYSVDNSRDAVTEYSNEGNDIVYASIDYALPVNVESVVLIEGSAAVNAAGNGLDNALIGNSNDNVLDGQGGADYMVGGLGNDIYLVDNIGDQIVENPNEGNDIVYAFIDCTIGANVESVILVEGSSAINAAGNSADNALYGNSNNNALDGKGGADYMVGGLGNDIYIVDNVGDEVVENPNEGNDIVYASINYTIGANVESVVLVEGSPAINAAGNGADNALHGNSNNNILDGKGGSDYMVGGLGNDLYFVDNVGDQVVENPGEGTDTIRTSVSYTLPANVENLLLLESAGAINGSGNSAANTITGNSFDNIINGAGGADTLKGGGGNDRFLIPDDTFASIDGGAGLDRITLNGPTDQTFNLTADAAKITNVEIVSLAAVSHAQLALTATDIAQINSSGNFLYVVGGSDDEVQLGDIWTLVSTSHTNSAVDPGATFVHYHNTSADADLYISDLIAFPVVAEANNPATHDLIVW